ncbi:MAG TPA: hypothetical protein VEI96_06210 [Thermodesulfovibrionales bacterium]|nr:hypothetical protein [Thermodesulfovibrionales bacterium]
MRSDKLSSLLLIIFMAVFFVSCEQHASVPTHLVGVWKTSAPKYADRYLKFTDSKLIFGVGDGKEVEHAIEKIKVKKEDNQTTYTFHYKDEEGEKWTLVLFYTDDSGGTIQQRYHNELWRKARE